MPPITSYDHELLYAPPLANNGRMEDVWEAYHYPFQALMEEARRQEERERDIWDEISDIVANTWRAGGLGGVERIAGVDEGDERWKARRRKELEGKEVAVWQEKGLTSWFAKKFMSGKRKLKSF